MEAFPVCTEQALAMAAEMPYCHSMYIVRAAESPRAEEGISLNIDLILLLFSLLVCGRLFPPLEE